MKTTTKQVTTSMTFEVTVHLTATETADETGADISEVSLESVEVEGFCLLDWYDASAVMTRAAQKGDWTDA